MIMNEVLEIDENRKVSIKPTDMLLSYQDAKILIEALGNYAFWPSENGLKAREVIKRISEFIEAIEEK